MLKINAGDDSDGDDLGYEPAARADGFSLSQSGAFTVKDFRINTMGLAPLVESDSPVAKTLSSASVRRGLNVESIEDLEMLEELGSGMSGTVWSALHKPTGVIMAVKKIQILEKAKRDQAISELRIMRKHECPWLVSLFNAFYEDTKVYTVRHGRCQSTAPGLPSFLLAFLPIYHLSATQGSGVYGCRLDRHPRGETPG